MAMPTLKNSPPQAACQLESSMESWMPVARPARPESQQQVSPPQDE
jgi:hypothetical protein